MQKILVLGANGPTGRHVVRLALQRDLQVEALTRNLDGFPITHDLLRVTRGDATDPAVIESAVAANDAVISVIGAAYTRRRVDVYSASGRPLVDAMTRHGLRRLIVVTSTSVAPESRDQGRFISDRVVLPLLRHTIGRTVYDDMDRLETIVRATSLDWTIVRPPGLTNQPGTGDFTHAETHVQGMLCARDDLAAFLLDQLEETRYIAKIAAIASAHLHVDARRMLREEILKR